MVTVEWIKELSDKVGYIDKKFPQQPEEIDEGNREYKWILNSRLHLPAKLATQLKYRLCEGNGKALYIVGILDDGTPIGAPIDQLAHTLALLFEASHIIKETKVDKLRFYSGMDGYIATVRFSNKTLEGFEFF